MDKNKKGQFSTNLYFIATLFVACLYLYGDIRRMLDLIQISNEPINEVTYSHFNVTVYTASDTYHLQIWFPLLTAFVGIVYNLIHLLMKYFKTD
ncbi:hypothetical protein [Paenibacillus sp. JDR-2]|uniref:hypothetical protein n=1 Tax=Paenibacillus sp. (strain JDR-2) TaxID=324057 RepID=UPI0001665C02|nr:hypothetical protein [Paenibacillus sp. JDR-2]ACT03194.1 hypothetical protein Pjdr2_4578 [Paenibacillus sp. JDR-2]